MFLNLPYGVRFKSFPLPSGATDISINNRISRDLYRNRKFRRHRRVRLAMDIARCVGSLTAGGGKKNIAQSLSVFFVIFFFSFEEQ